MNNTLIDNSIEALSMTTTLRKCLAIDGIKTVSIATGYWDIPGLAILQENLRSFIEKEGTTLRLLIGKDPYIYVNQLKSPINPEKPDVPLNKNDAFQKVQKRRVQEKR